MGSVRKFLYKSKLPEREKHHSRLFIDLAENIHIHHREYRTVFSLDEYFEYADIVAQSTKDVRSFLEQNPAYKEGVYPTTIMIAGGKERQLKFLKNSKKPNESSYYDDEFAIELQDEYVTDEVHIHYRDFRIGLDRSRFRVMAEGFKEAIAELNEFESQNVYERISHPDRIIESFNEGNADSSTKVMGVEKIKIEDVSSHWYKDINDWKPNRLAIEELINRINDGDKLSPIILSTEKNGEHKIVDGHHRFFAISKAGKSFVDAIVLDITFDMTAKLRQAEVCLKEFDVETNYEFGISDFLKSFISYRLNRYYASAFTKKMNRNSLVRRIARKLLEFLGAKEYVFKKFNESHNHHN